MNLVSRPYRPAGAGPRRRRTVLVAAVTAVLAGLPSGIGPASASGVAITGRDAEVDINPDETNPCTGAVGDLVDDERDSWTVVARPDGSGLWRGHSESRVTFLPYDRSAATYTGEEVFTDVQTLTRGSDAVRVDQRFRLHGTDGATITFTSIRRLVVTSDGTTRIDVESNSLTCG